MSACCQSCAQGDPCVTLSGPDVTVPTMPGMLPNDTTQLQRAMQPFLRHKTGRTMLVIIKGTRANVRAVQNAVATLFKLQSKHIGDWGLHTTEATTKQLRQVRDEMTALDRSLNSARWVLENADGIRKGTVVPAEANSELPAWFRSHPDWTLDTLDVLPPGMDYITRNVEWSSIPARYRQWPRFLTPAYIAPMAAMNRLVALREHIATQVHAFSRFVFQGIIDAVKRAVEFLDEALPDLPKVDWSWLFWPAVIAAGVLAYREQRA